MLNVAVLALLLIGLTMQEDPLDYARPDPPTRFEISAKKGSYYVGEPVELKVSVYNDRDRPIKGYFYLALSLDLEVYYRKVGGWFIKYYPGWLEYMQTGGSCSVLIGDTVLPAHGRKEASVRLFYNTPTNNFVLSEPGQYEFKVVTGNMQSQVVRVRVVEPPEEERAVLLGLKDRELLSFVEGDIGIYTAPLEDVESAAEKAVAFLQKYPKSIYAPMVEQSLRRTLKATDRPYVDQLTPRLKAIKDALPDQ